MNIYSFRAECMEDVKRFLLACVTKGIITTGDGRV